ncbi:MAG: hypothetical protein AB1716_10875 [Planctomycetota bacterium]
MNTRPRGSLIRRAAPAERRHVQLTARQQTAAEQQEFECALDLLLSELVRQTLVQKQEGHP